MRLAVVIGISEYQNFPTLENAKNDASAVEDKLKSLGYEVSKTLNCSKNNIYDCLTSVLENWKHDASEIVLFYAGHGVTVGKLHC